MHQTESDLIFSVTIACAGMGVIAFFLIVVIINYYRTNTRKQNEIFNAVLDSQLKERKRISEDLHDELGPFLAGIKMRVGTLKDMNDAAERDEMITETESALNKAIQEVRSISKNLMPKNLEEHGLLVELAELKNLIEKSRQVKMNLAVSGLEKRLSPLFEINIFRIINELVNNSLKHSEADTIDISLNKSKDDFRIVFSDNGKGFSPGAKADGLGLKNIESRVNLFKGKFVIDSRENRGTTFRINFQNDNLKLASAGNENQK